MDYGEVLSNAWKTIWKYKVLWLFGILAALGSGGGYGGNGGSSSYRQGDPRSFLNPNLGDRAGAWLQQNSILLTGVVILAVMLALVALAVVVVLGTYGRVGLARGAWKADEGAERLTFGALFAESGHYFVRVLLLAVLIFVVGIALALFVVFPAVIFGALTIICFLPLICVLVVAGWAIQIIIRMAIIAIVGEDLGLFAGLQRAWDVFRSHLGESIIMGLILTVGSGILHFLLALPFLAVAVPFAFLALNQGTAALRSSFILAGVLFCLYLPVAIFLSGVVESYVGSAWTLTFRRLTGRAHLAAEVPAV